MERYQVRFRCGFLLTPLREGRPPIVLALSRIGNDFYSRPCGRGDVTDAPYTYTETEFLLTPLREGRRGAHRYRRRAKKHFYSRPCGRGDPSAGSPYTTPGQFLLTPLREGRRSMINTKHVLSVFLLTPLREGRRPWGRRGSTQNGFLLTPLREGRPLALSAPKPFLFISTHAPAGGATAIFHKSVMRFCGKLPKDDTVLCLASFGFPRRDPKAVYLAWISCANLPQKCVREGLALKDQGTSCFHEGLASHAFDPVLV